MEREGHRLILIPCVFTPSLRFGIGSGALRRSISKRCSIGILQRASAAEALSEGKSNCSFWKSGTKPVLWLLNYGRDPSKGDFGWG
jgi:hypothetical protein